MMANFLLLYQGGKMPESEAEQQRFLKEWEKWFASMGSGVVDGGNPTTPVAKNITAEGKVSDVPAVSMVSGYSIIKADSLDAAVALAKRCPVLKGGASVMVFETFNAM